jgi:hypothetical protein
MLLMGVQERFKRRTYFGKEGTSVFDLMALQASA